MVNNPATPSGRGIAGILLILISIIGMLAGITYMIITL